ncbi:ABC transporter permease [Microbulbifer litoralis]|uniref:ABC transporter permease n=1 Tax=Microbulbifer litoralis TaxID=2933965 RepID=UPI002029031B|nr:ABC transporter permease [Microbulbifer sp. GX H0434]
MSAWKLVQLEANVRYKKTNLGIVWYLLAFVFKVAVLGGVYTKALGKPPAEYLPYLVLGVSLWGFVSGSIQYGCVALINNEKFIYFDNARLFFFVFKGVMREFLFASLLMSWSLFLTCVLTDVAVVSLLLFMLGMALVFVAVYLVACILAFICLVRADVTHFISSMMNVFFIATPIIWDSSDAPGLQKLMVYNPFYYLIEVMRSPVLGRELPPTLYVFFIVLIPVLLLLLWGCSKLVRKGFASYV